MDAAPPVETECKDFPADKGGAASQLYRLRAFLPLDQLADLLRVQRDVRPEILQQDEAVVIEGGAVVVVDHKATLLSGAVWRYREG